MPRRNKEKVSNKRDKRGEQPITRRQFLKETGTIIGGAAIASMAFTSACGSAGDTTTSATTTNTTTSTNTNTTGTSTNTNTLATTTTTLSTTAHTSTTISTSTWDGVYTPPVANPELKVIPGCESTVAMDRLYAIEHTWVQFITDDIVVVGITDKFQAFLVDIFHITLQDVDQTLYRDQYFADVEASKMNVELVSPVSGIILQNNTEVTSNTKLIHKNPYTRGWLYVIKLNNPEELDELMVAEDYLSYCAKVIDQ